MSVPSNNLGEAARKADLAKAVQMAEKVIADNYISRPPVRVFELAKNYGLMVKESTALNSTISGFIYIETNVIVINASEPVTRQAFTVAHELGHWLLHHPQLENNPDLGIMYRSPLGGQVDPTEQEANTFAANLLVPKMLLSEYQGLEDGRVANIFAVSEEVIRYRKAKMRYS